MVWHHYVGYRTVYALRQAYPLDSVEFDAKGPTIYQEAFMTQQTKDPHQKPGQTHPSPLEDVNKAKEKAKEQEVAGRHKNDGQKDHTGANKGTNR